MLMSAGDTPLVTHKAVQDLIDNAPEADIVFPIIERSDVEREFPSRKWICIRTAEGDFTGANCFLFSSDELVGRREWLRKVMDSRRNLPRLIGLLGLGFVLRYLGHRLSIRDVERRASELLGLEVRAYVSPYPEIAMDIDHPDDVEIVRGRLESRAERSNP